MQKDKEKQDIYLNSTEPSVSYKYCDTLLFVINKILEDYSDQPMRVILMFDLNARRRLVFMTMQLRKSSKISYVLSLSQK